MTRYCRGSTVTPTSPSTVNKGKGKSKVEEVEEEDGEGEEDEEDEMDEDEEEDDDDDVSQVQMPELPSPTKGSSQEDHLDEIDPTAILSSGRRTRGIRVDYTSKEALNKAGLKAEDEVEEEGEDSHDENVMKE